MTYNEHIKFLAPLSRIKIAWFLFFISILSLLLYLSLFGKLKYEENLIDDIYKTEKNKSLVSATLMCHCV